LYPGEPECYKPKSLRAIAYKEPQDYRLGSLVIVAVIKSKAFYPNIYKFISYRA